MSGPLPPPPHSESPRHAAVPLPPPPGTPPGAPPPGGRAPTGGLAPPGVGGPFAQPAGTTHPAQPTSPGEREPILDLLRGVALLGILLVNIELMRGPDLYTLLAGQTPPEGSTADGIASFAVGWLASGKFISSFSILFGIGAALIVTRAEQRGHEPRGLLARRYGVLMAFGLAHMVLLFPGDILFVYGVTGMILLGFVGVRSRTALWWSAGLLGGIALLTTAFVGIGLLIGDIEVGDDDPFVAAVEDFADTRRAQAVEAFTDGHYGQIVVANLWQAAFVQAGQLFAIPWILGLFLFGFAVGRSGMIADLAGHRRRLRGAAAIGLGLGLPLNLVLGMVGPLATGGALGAGDVDGVLAAATVAELVGAPLLAVGYLAAIALLALRVGVPGPLAAVGRMALSAYLLQSVLALVVFAGFGLYDQLTPASGLLVVAGIWAVLLIACPLWLRAFRFGPVEWLWRSLSYARRQPMRRSEPDRPST